jgi:hypothetical protein
MLDRLPTEVLDLVLQQAAPSIPADKPSRAYDRAKALIAYSLVCQATQQPSQRSSPLAERTTSTFAGTMRLKTTATPALHHFQGTLGTLKENDNMVEQE